MTSVRTLLEVLVPLEHSDDAESVTDEDRQRLHVGRAWFAERGGRGIPMEDVLADFGLSTADFPSRS